MKFRKIIILVLMCICSLFITKGEESQVTNCKAEDNGEILLLFEDDSFYKDYVVLIVDDKIYKNIEIFEGDVITEVYDKQGYKFIGWEDRSSGKIYEEIEYRQGYHIYYAKFEIIVYQCTYFNEKGEVLGVYNCNIYSDINSVKAPELSGKRFKGWYCIEQKCILKNNYLLDGNYSFLPIYQKGSSKIGLFFINCWDSFYMSSIPLYLKIMIVIILSILLYFGLKSFINKCLVPFGLWFLDKVRSLINNIKIKIILKKMNDGKELSVKDIKYYLYYCEVKGIEPNGDILDDYISVNKVAE